MLWLVGMHPAEIGTRCLGPPVSWSKLSESGRPRSSNPAIIPGDESTDPETRRIDLPIRFPSDSDVIAEEAARFRALSPEARMRSIRNLLEAGAWMMRQSPKAAFLEENTRQNEKLAQRNIKELIARHAN
jgi:hypothetical protein